MKIQILSKLLFFTTFLISWLIICHYFKQPNLVAVAGISGGLAVLLSPGIKTIQSQSGESIQIKWMFLKKILVLKRK